MRIFFKFFSKILRIIIVSIFGNSYIFFSPHGKIKFRIGIKATITQFGFLSKFISIECGCCQGYYFSLDLLIIAAQILTILILINLNVKVFSVVIQRSGSISSLMTQY